MIFSFRGVDTHKKTDWDGKLLLRDLLTAMDLRTNQEGMGMQSRYSATYGSHMFNTKEAFEETDIKGNNNLFNSFKTETNIDHGHDPDSLFQVTCSNTKKLEVDNSLFSYSSFKKAMDLRTHNRTFDGGRRSIFEDAEYFAKNHCYKLLPITFEQVDETIIQSEHNYSLFSLTSGSEPEEDCSRLMDYSQIKEKNYKRRRTKFREGVDREELPESENYDGVYSSTALCGLSIEPEVERRDVSFDPEEESCNVVQPLDLSAPPPVQDEKTDPSLRQRPGSITGEAEELVQVDSDKENVNSEANGIRVTITRPDEKENYQPCDLFLNDIARLVPWLIDKDCLEVDILDRTCDGQDEFRKHRLYYVISESTWRLFQKTNERVILTNDQSLGQPLRKIEKVERPKYLVFDQFSLAKCLAEYCQEIGGCFEYTCVEEGKESERSKDDHLEEVKKELSEGAEKAYENVENLAEDKSSKERGMSEKASRESNEESQNDDQMKEERKEVTKEVVLEGNDMSQATERPCAHRETSKSSEVSVPDAREVLPVGEGEMLPVGEEGEVLPAGEEGEAKPTSAVESQDRVEEQKTKEIKKDSKGKGTEKQGKVADSKKKLLPTRPKPKNFRMTTRSKSTSESETSQKSDKQIKGKERRKREGSASGKAGPPGKLKKSVDTVDLCRRTRSGKVLYQPKPGKVLGEQKPGKETGSIKKRAGSEGSRKSRKETRGVGKLEVTGRTLRSQKLKQQGKRKSSRGKR